jgi:hypothetical protein
MYDAEEFNRMSQIVEFFFIVLTGRCAILVGIRSSINVPILIFTTQGRGASLLRAGQMLACHFDGPTDVIEAAVVLRIVTQSAIRMIARVLCLIAPHLSVVFFGRVFHSVIR